jgi:predicted dehydrogenase
VIAPRKDPLHVGVIGGGLIAQAAHLPSLQRLDHLFTISALAEPSRRVREGVAARYHIPATYEQAEDLLADSSVDAVAICAPQATHAALVLSCLAAGKPVFVEKPLCITLADADRIAAEQERTGLVVQVGYMKRFDPGYETLLSAAAAEAERLRFIDVVTTDPRMVRPPFFLDNEIITPDDLPSETSAGIRRSWEAQVAESAGRLDPESLAAFSGLFLDAIVHDVNLVHGLLDVAGQADGVKPVSARYWANGEAGSAIYELADGARWHSTFMFLRGLNEFREQLSFYYPATVHTLTFQAPYHQQLHTVYACTSGSEDGNETRSLAAGHANYLRGWQHFYDCVTNGQNCRTNVAMARRDMAAIIDLFDQGVTTRQMSSS